MICHDRIRILAGKLLEQDTYVFFTCRQLVNLLSWRAAVVVDPHPGKDLLDPTVWMLASGGGIFLCRMLAIGGGISLCRLLAIGDGISHCRLLAIGCCGGRGGGEGGWQ